MRWLRRIPTLAWLALVPALIIGSVQLRTGGGMPAHVVGSGPLTLVEAGDAPEETYYRFYVTPAESLEATAERSLANLGLWPDMILLASDERALASSMSREEEVIARGLIRSVAEGEAADYRSRVERMNTWMREDLCRGGEIRHCVDIGSDGGDANQMRPSAQAPWTTWAPNASARSDAVAAFERREATPRLPRA